MSAQVDSNIFPRARNLAIFGGTFTNMTVNPAERPGLRRLLENIAPGAFHDAAERGELPKCHPRTRVAIREEIMQWIKDPGARRQFITWLYGPAGSGKTAIAQSIAEACEKEGLLAASFFFGRLANGRNTSAHFVATIAYQLSRSIPEIEDQLLTTIEKDPSIFSRSLSTQMRVLIIEPLKSVPLHSLIRFIVVDGVDECGPNDQAHAELLKVLGAAIAELRNIPIIFLITSRPEYNIRTAFNKNPLSSLTKSLVLDNKYMPDKDIKVYLESKLSEIRQDHLPLSCERWPAESDVNLLVSKASGQFIFASTVIKFIDSPRHNPADRLKIVLGLASAGKETPFAILDSLYRFILGSVLDIQKVLEVLTLLLLACAREKNLPLDLAEELLGFDIRRALVDMHALLFVPPHTDNHLPRIYHASLYDFLMDYSRSLEYYIDTIRGHDRLCQHWLKIIGNCTQSRNHTVDAVNAFVAHCRHLNSPTEELVDDLAHFDLRASLEGISDIWANIYNPDWGAFMECINQLGAGRNGFFPHLQNDFDSFILNRIDRYPQSLQPYIPIILLQRLGHNNVFEILLRGTSNSAEEFNELRDQDKGLLDVPLASYPLWHIKYPIQELFKDRERSGRHFADGGCFTDLAKVIVNVICAKPGEKNYQIAFYNNRSTSDRYPEGSDPTLRIVLKDPNLEWFEEILDNASTDLDLANILCDRAVLFRSDIEPIPGRRRIAKASIKYIQRCGIPFLKHAHQPYTNECGICMWHKGAIVVEDILNVTDTLTSSSPIPE